MFLRANNIVGSSELNIELTTPDDILDFCDMNKNMFEEVGE